MAFPSHRPRRLRSTPAMRRLVAQTRWSHGIWCCRCSSPTASTSPATFPQCPAWCSTPVLAAPCRRRRGGCGASAWLMLFVGAAR